MRKVKPKSNDRKIIERAVDQLDAMLLFASLPRDPSRFALDQYRKGLVEMSDILLGVVDAWPICEGCSKPIAAGQAYTCNSEDSIYFHSRCAGVPASECCRMETPAQMLKSMKDLAAEVRADLRKRGLIA